MTTTSNPDEYNGWTNRETWAASLYLSNDQGLYNLALDLARDSIRVQRAKRLERVAATSMMADALQEQFDTWAAEIIDVPADTSRDLRAMLADVGSRWRIDFRAVGQSYLDEIYEGQ